MTSARALPMYHKHVRLFVITFALLMVYAVLPMSAHAASGLTDSQIQAVSNLLASFNTDPSVVAKVESTLRGGDASSRPTPPKPPQGFGQGMGSSTMPGASVCGMIERNLKRGSEGEDVSVLQQFLQKTGDLSQASTTKYFGPVTEKALQQWQARLGIAKEGDADSTGFGAVGPKTRMMVMAHCKEVLGDLRMNNSASSTDGTKPAPTCVLKAEKSTVAAGESTVLMWESKYATHASSVTGEKGPVRGSIKVTPTETTSYIKRVYGPGGEGSCTATVMVGDDTTPATEQKVVYSSPIQIDFGRITSLMGSGAAAAMDGYLSLFGLSLASLQ